MHIRSSNHQHWSSEQAATLLGQSRQLAPLFQEYAEKNEVDGKIHANVVSALEKENLFGLFAAQAVGGADLRPSDAIQVIENVAYADAATSWVLFATGLAIGAAAALLPDDAVHEIFSDGVPIIGGQGIPNGRAVVESGGYRLSGHWNYGSGTLHSSYIHTGAIVYDGNNPRLDAAGAPEVRIFHVPRSEVETLGNWDVLGLRATGSVDYAISDVFVPEEFTYFARTTHPLRGSNTFRMGSIGVGAAGHTAFALGVGRRVLDELATFAQARVGRPGLLGESESFLEKFASAEARYRSARALVYETWHATEATLERGDALNTREITLIRLALNHATWTVADICNFSYNVAGGVSLRNGVIQRYFRDMHAGTQHVTSSPTMLRECGRDLAGVAPGKKWNFFGLMDNVAT